MTYEVSISPKAQRELSNLKLATEFNDIKDAIFALSKSQQPEGHKKLKGQNKRQTKEALHRISVGDYRIIYKISKREKRVIIAAVVHRRDVYKNTQLKRLKRI